MAEPQNLVSYHLRLLRDGVLFVYSGSSARSPIAEALLHHRAGGRVESDLAGDAARSMCSPGGHRGGRVLAWRGCHGSSRSSRPRGVTIGGFGPCISSRSRSPVTSSAVPGYQQCAVVELAGAGSQIIMATHSPILLAVPGARVLQIDAEGAITEVPYDAAMPVTVTRAFLADPGRFLHHLLTDG